MVTEVQSNAAQRGQFRIEEVGLGSPIFDEVVKLHAVGKARLGPFPRGAFEDHARLKMILAAISDENILAGYILYRVARRANRASIVHLSTSERFRKNGVARLLVNRLKEKTKHLHGISLRCRRDYNIGDMWQSLAGC
jgi:GNAT superfamily N-acetyltransferase